MVRPLSAKSAKSPSRRVLPAVSSKSVNDGDDDGDDGDGDGGTATGDGDEDSESDAEEVQARRVGAVAAIASRLLPAKLFLATCRALSARPYVDKVGRDLYSWTFVTQFAVLLVTIASYASITTYGGAAETVSEQLSYNQFNGNMILAVLAVMVLMVLDRVAYLKRAAWLKLVLHVGVTVTIHATVFFAIPLATNRPFTSSGPLILFYVSWLAYLLVSACQLHYGFGTAPPRDSLKSAGYGSLPSTAFSIYLAVPFLAELRQILDWVCTPTALDLGQWMKLETVHVNLFFVQADMVGRLRGIATWSGRRAQSFCYKFWSGVCLFVALILVVLLPALIFSTLNPTLGYNDITAVSVTLSLRGAVGSYTLFSSSQLAQLADADHVPRQPNYWAALRANATAPGQPCPLDPSWDAETQQAVLFTFPDALWEISPPGLANLQELLQAANATGTPADPPPQVWVDLRYAFTRPQPAGQQTIAATSSVLLSPAAAGVVAGVIGDALAADASGSSSSGGTTVGTTVTIHDLYPLVLRLPATSNPVQLGSAMRTVQLGLHSGNDTGVAATATPGFGSVPLWWTVAIDPHDRFAWSTRSGLVFNTVSDRVAPALVQSLGGYSILALYVTVVLAVGRLVRSGFGADIAAIPYNELPDCTDLLEVCEGIHAAERARYPSHLIDEMNLYRILMRLLRSPELLLRVTKRKDE